MISVTPKTNCVTPKNDLRNSPESRNVVIFLAIIAKSFHTEDIRLYLHVSIFYDTPCKNTYFVLGTCTAILDVVYKIYDICITHCNELVPPEKYAVHLQSALWQYVFFMSMSRWTSLPSYVSLTLYVIMQWHYFMNDIQMFTLWSHILTEIVVYLVTQKLTMSRFQSGHVDHDLKEVHQSHIILYSNMF